MGAFDRFTRLEVLVRLEEMLDLESVERTDVLEVGDVGNPGVRGKTAEAALEGLIVASKQRSGLHARLAPIGYVGSASRTYILERSGTPWATAVVIPEGGGYVAMLDALC